jgi:uncharacterized protein
VSNILSVNTGQNEILASIKTEILSVVPEAKVFLFGSRSRGDFHDESDWDILIITPISPDRTLKNKIHNILFPLSVEICSFINTIIVSETDWLNSPNYYSLHMATANETIPL